MSRALTAAELQALERAWLLGTQRSAPTVPPALPPDEHALTALAWRAQQLALTTAPPRSEAPTWIEAPEDPRPTFPDSLRPALRRLVIAAEARRQSGLLTAVAWWMRDAGVRLHPFDTWGSHVSELAPAAGAYEAWLTTETGRIPKDDRLPAATEETWVQYGPASRYRWLAAQRDEDPERALALLQACWSSERAEVRHRLLQALHVNPGPYDREFLEGLAKDRSRKVKELAAILLARVPGSDAHEATRDMLRQAIRVKKARGGAQLDIAPGADLRHVLLSVAHFHPHHLAEALGFDNALLVGHGDAPALGPAFAVGALRHGDDTVLDHILARIQGLRPPLSLWLELLDGLPPEKVRVLARRLLQGEAAASLLEHPTDAAEWSQLMQGPLSVEGAAALRSTPAWQAALDGLVGEDGHDIATALGAIAILIPPAGAREALAEIEARGANAAPLIQALWRLLAELHEVSVDPAPPGR